MDLFLNIHWSLSGRSHGVQKEEKQTYSSSFFFHFSVFQPEYLGMCILSPTCERVHQILYQNIDRKKEAEFSLHLLPLTSPGSKSEQ